MPSAEFIFDFTLSVGTVILSGLLIALLLVRGLQRTYPVFFAYWLFDLFYSALPLLTPDLQTQARAQLICMVIRWVLYFLLVIELIDRILVDHPGIARLGRRLVQGVMVFAVVGSLYTLQFDSAPQPTIDSRLHLTLQLERVVSGCLLVLLLAVVAFLWFFPVRLNRNTKAYCFGFTIFFLAKTIAPFVLNTKGVNSLDLANAIVLGGVLFCQTLWLFSITRRGAEATAAFRAHWTLDEQHKALAALAALEGRISRTRGR